MLSDLFSSFWGRAGLPTASLPLSNHRIGLELVRDIFHGGFPMKGKKNGRFWLAFTAFWLVVAFILGVLLLLMELGVIK